MGIASSTSCFVGSDTSGPRPLMQLHQLRSLDIILMSPKRTIAGTSVPYEVSRMMSAHIQQAHTPPEVTIDKFDTVGLISVTPKAMKYGISYDTVNVIMATPFGLRSIPLGQVLAQCTEVAIRQVFLPGETPRRSEVEIPHPMPTADDAVREARAAAEPDWQRDPIYGVLIHPSSGAKQIAEPAITRSPESVLFSNTYSLLEPNTPVCPLNGQIHSAGAASHRRELHTRLIEAVAPILNCGFGDEQVAALLQSGWDAVRQGLLVGEASQQEMEKVAEILKEYCQVRSKLRDEARTKAQDLVSKRLAAEKEGATVDRINRELMGDEDDVMEKPVAHETEEERIDRLKRANQVRAAVRDDADASSETHHQAAFLPDQLCYGDLTAVLAMLCAAGQRVMFSTEEIISLIELFLDPRRSHAHVNITEFLDRHWESIARNVEYAKRHAAVISGVVCSRLLQVAGILPDGPQHMYAPMQFIQGCLDASTNMRSLLSKEHRLPIPIHLPPFDEMFLYRRERRMMLRRILTKRLLERREIRLSRLENDRATADIESRRREEKLAVRRRLLEQEMAAKVRAAEAEAEAMEQAELQREREAREAAELEVMEQRRKEKEEEKSRRLMAKALAKANGEEDEEEDEDEEELNNAGQTREEAEAEAEANRISEEEARQARIELMDEIGEDRAALVTFAVTNLPGYLLTPGFATTCAVWDTEGVDEQGNPTPALVAYTPAVRADLNPDYQAACMLSFARDRSNLLEVLICNTDDPQSLASAPVVGRATVDMVQVLGAFLKTSDHMVYPLQDPHTGGEVGALEVLVFSNDMTELVLYLGSEVSVFEEDHGSVLCTYEGLQALLRAAGGDLDACQDALKVIDERGAKYGSMCELAAAVATLRGEGRAVEGSYADAAYSEAVRSAVYESLSSFGVVDVSAVSPAMVEPLLRVHGHLIKTISALSTLPVSPNSSWQSFLGNALHASTRSPLPNVPVLDEDELQEIVSLVEFVVILKTDEYQVRSAAPSLVQHMGGFKPLVQLLHALSTAKFMFQTLDSLTTAITKHVA